MLNTQQPYPFPALTPSVVPMEGKGDESMSLYYVLMEKTKEYTSASAGLPFLVY